MQTNMTCSVSRLLEDKVQIPKQIVNCGLDYKTVQQKDTKHIALMDASRIISPNGAGDFNSISVSVSVSGPVSAAEKFAKPTRALGLWPAKPHYRDLYTLFYYQNKNYTRLWLIA